MALDDYYLPTYLEDPAQRPLVEEHQAALLVVLLVCMITLPVVLLVWITTLRVVLRIYR